MSHELPTPFDRGACREAALSLMCSDPKRAEETLEDLAELFRPLMRDKRRLINRRPDAH